MAVPTLKLNNGHEIPTFGLGTYAVRNSNNFSLLRITAIAE